MREYSSQFTWIWENLSKNIKKLATKLQPYIQANVAHPITIPFKEGSVGPKVTFTKHDYIDKVDVIIPGVLELTRDSQGGLYNKALQSHYSNHGPQNTQWSTPYIDPSYNTWEPLWDITNNNRSYTFWEYAVKVPNISQTWYVPPMYVGMPAIMWEVTTNRYWLIMFTEWTPGANGGGFSYDRYEIYPPVYFFKPDYATQVVDQISSGVRIARQDCCPLYNPIVDSEGVSQLTPTRTRWNSAFTDPRVGYNGYSDLSNLEDRIYTSFALALDNQIGNHVLSTDLVMHDLTTDLYYKVNFSQWTQGGNGGGFAYARTVIPQIDYPKRPDGTPIK